MKKFYAFALMAFMGATVANAQALKLDKNYVIYTEHDGTTSLADAMPMVDTENYFYFPVQGGQLNEAVHHLTKDYTDSETGVSFKAGDYQFISANTEIKFKHGSADEGYPQGLSNIKKVIFYIGGNGSLQTYTRMTQKDEDGDNYVNYEGEPETNRSWSYYFAPDLTFKSTPEKIGENTWYTADDSELTYSSPIKLTVDLTNNIDGTEEEIATAKYTVNCSPTNNDYLTTGSFSKAWYYAYDGGDAPVTEKRMLFQFFEKDAEGKQSENKIAWSADNRYGIALKKNAFVMAVALVCGDENAETEVIKMKADDETGISSVVAEGAAKSNEMYNLAGQRIATPVSGQIYIQNGKKYIAE